jgi:endo-1,4-beta-xylanase
MSLTARAHLITATLMFLLGVRPALGAETADPLADAQDRIETHRMGDGLVRVVDDQGHPIAGATVRVEQTRHAFLFGSNIYAWGHLNDPQQEEAYRRQFADVFNFATIGFYWANYESRQGAPNHPYAEAVARWCAEQGIATKGHPLAWNYTDPRWLPDDPAAVRRLQMARIDDCVARFAGLIDRWDVVNEAVHFERDELVQRAPKMTNMWLDTGRIEFTRMCFEHARRANPEALLLINDYRNDPPYEQLIEQLIDDEGQPLYDVIGLQSHMHGGTWPNEVIWGVCERFRRFNVPLHFTELTVLSGPRGWELEGDWPSTEEGEAEQAREVRRIYTLLFSHPAVEAITWWDFSDARAWQRAPAGFLRQDMTPKPAYDVLKELIKDRWWTRAELTTDTNGSAPVRGFLGDYQFHVRQGDRHVTANGTLERNQQNRWLIVLP